MRGPNERTYTKLRLEFQVEYGFKLEFQVELLIHWEGVAIWRPRITMQDQLKFYLKGVFIIYMNGGMGTLEAASFRNEPFWRKK